MESSNSDDAISNLSDCKGSCREVDSVYKTTEMLYKVVRFANVAFFSGDLEVAYNVLRDALRLFTRLDNSKAVAVASNNLGNTMLTIYRTMEANGGSDEMCGLTRKIVVQKGTAFFAQSIRFGEVAYDKFYGECEERSFNLQNDSLHTFHNHFFLYPSNKMLNVIDEQGWSEECLVFMQHLANRYFNRAIFFLTTSADHDNPKEAQALGFRDLQITGDMDEEIVNQCLESGFRINRTVSLESAIHVCLQCDCCL